MKEKDKRFVIPPAMLPVKGTKEIDAGGKTYLLKNEAMFTGYQHSQAEFSDFFMKIRDECRIMAKTCPLCSVVIIPPFMLRCEACNFTEMVDEEVFDVGFMAATPVITMFAPARFKDEVPFATGRVYLETWDTSLTDTAMLIRARTTKGAIRPGIYTRDMRTKVVFAKERTGSIRDIFLIPYAELTPEQLSKSPLIEDEIDWNQVPDVEFSKPSKEQKMEFQRIKICFDELGRQASGSPRAKGVLENWKRKVRVSTEGGDFSFLIDNGALRLISNGASDIIFTITDQKKLLSWLEEGNPPLTDLVMEGSLLLNKTEMETITRLDRVPRAIRRDLG